MHTQTRMLSQPYLYSLPQVPRSTWEKEESVEKERNEGEVQSDALLSSSVSVTAETSADRETEGENDQQRRGVIERERARAMDRGPDREREKNATVSRSHGSTAPSSGKDRPDSTLSTMREWERETRMGMERPKDGERGRERPKDRQRESRISKERTREKEKGRDREREREPSWSRSYSTSHDAERKDRQQGDNRGSNKSFCCPGRKSSSSRRWESSAVSRAAKLPAHIRGMFMDLKITDKDHSLYYHNPQAQSGNNRHKDRPAGTHHSSPSLPRSRGKERDLLLSEPAGGSGLSKPRTSSPAQEFMQNRSRNESVVEKEEWKQKRVDEVDKEGKWLRDNQDILVEKKRGGQWEDEADKLDRQAKWELEEGERSSSSSSKSGSSSASQESSGDDKRKECTKKQKKHRKEKRQAAAPELLEEGELKKHKHKKSKKSRDGGEW